MDDAQRVRTLEYPSMLITTTQLLSYGMCLKRGLFGLQESLHSAKYGILTFRMLVSDQIAFLIHNAEQSKVTFATRYVKR